MSIFRAVKQALWCVKEIAKAECLIGKPYDWAAKRKKWEAIPSNSKITIDEVPESYEDLLYLMAEEGSTLWSRLLGKDGEAISVQLSWPEHDFGKAIGNFSTWHMSASDRWQHTLRFENALVFVHFKDRR